MQKIAIIGAGLSGVLCAFYLKSKAHVSIFEKARGVGGRLSRTIVDEVPCNLGSPIIEAHPIWPSSVEIFSQPVNSCLHSLLQASQANLFCTTRVGSMLKESSSPHVSLFDESGLFLGTFDWVIVSIPLPQARILCPGLDLPAREYQSVLTVFLSQPLTPNAQQCAENIFRVDLLSQDIPSAWTPFLLKQHLWKYAYPSAQSTPPPRTVFEQERIVVIGDGVSHLPGTLGALDSVASWLNWYSAL